jgi:hypothetical protein
MSVTQRAVLIIVVIVWLIGMPLAFATLYSVIELQSAARAASKDDNRLTTLRTVELADKLHRADAAKSRSDALGSQRNDAWVNVMESRTRARVVIIDFLTGHGVSGATALCTGTANDVRACQLRQDPDGCYNDWTKVLACSEQAESKAHGAKDDQDIAALKRQMADAREKGFAYNRLNRRISEQNAVENDPLRPVAEAYEEIHLPLFSALFVLPQGVIVACFTSLMAALGAGVSSLLNFLRSDSSSQARQDLARSFIVSPLLGGLIGFMVYFVVSAGTAFLVQPAPANPAQATNNLSAPALAALGVLAGLAAENAVDWLQAKAAAFFKTST